MKESEVEMRGLELMKESAMADKALAEGETKRMNFLESEEQRAEAKKEEHWNYISKRSWSMRVNEEKMNMKDGNNCAVILQGTKSSL